MSPFPEEVEETLDPAEIGHHGCMIPQTDNDSDAGHCDAQGEDDE